MKKRKNQERQKTGKSRGERRGNLVFILITICVVFTSVISNHLDCITQNPFAKTYVLENPVQVVRGKDANYYVIDSSYRLAIANQKDQLLSFLEGGNPESTYDIVCSVLEDEDGVFYLHDKSVLEDGTTAYQERIIKFWNRGKKREVLYTLESVDDDNVQTASLDAMTLIDGTLHFAQITGEGIQVLKYEGEEVTTVSEIPLAQAFYKTADCSINSKLQVAVAYKTGKVYICEGKRKQLAYTPEYHSDDVFPAMVTELAYDTDDTLYMNDAGLRRIYKLKDKELSLVVERAEFLETKPEVFAENPLYSGMTVAEGGISVLTVEYSYDQDTEESYNTYSLATVNREGEACAYIDSIGISMQRRLYSIMVYACLFALIAIAIYAVISLVLMLREQKLVQNNVQLIALATALLVTIGVSYAVFERSNVRLVDESAANMSNIAYLIEGRLDKQALKIIDNPEHFLSNEYDRIDQEVQGILKSEVNESRNVYCVIYKMANNTICEIYRNDHIHGPMYQMPGVYAGSIEENIANEGIRYVDYGYEMSEGSYTFALIPVYDEQEELLAFIEVGTDYNQFASENQELFKKLELLSFMVVIIVMLLFSEILYGAEALKEYKKGKGSRRALSPDLIRPIAFFVFFTANITTVFLPLYGMSLWTDAFPIQEEVAAALPLSAELICSAVAALFSGFAVKKTGIRVMNVLGGLFYVGGNLLSAFAGNLWILILANSCCGIGGGMLLIAVNTWIAGLDTEEHQNRGYMHYNAAYLAGMNCGTVIGSLVWEKFGVVAAYLVATISAVILVLLSIFLLTSCKDSINTEEKAEKKRHIFKEFGTLRVIRYFIGIAIPYLICASFLSYFFPVVAERNALSAMEISMAFLISGVISIYTGSVISELVMNKLGTKKAMVLASFIYGVALLYLVVNPSMINFYVVIVLFALADSFGLSAQSVYFASMPEVEKIGQSKALGINSTIESIASACGPVIFGSILLLGEQKGIFVLGIIFMLLLALFVIPGGEKQKNQ